MTQQEAAQSISEPEKYRRCYQLPEYKMGPRRMAHALANIDLIPEGASYLDVACGRAETVKHALARGVMATGLDFVEDLCDGVTVLHGNMLKMPFALAQFEYVSCYDAVEHLPTDQVDTALNELFRVARTELRISTNDARSHLGDLELHLTRKPRAWWEAKLTERAEPRGWVLEWSTFADPKRDWSWRIAAK